MNQKSVVEILRVIDSVEADLRSCEVRLTRVRDRLLRENGMGQLLTDSECARGDWALMGSHTGGKELGEATSSWLAAGGVIHGQTLLTLRVIHGLTCAKAVHLLGAGYLHDASDDTPYDVDGVRYCGRCHMAF